MNERKIVLLVKNRGFHCVCEIEGNITDYAFWVPYWNSRTIRIWGTRGDGAQGGLDLLYNGPTTETVLDAVGPSGYTFVGNIIDCRDVDQDAWRPYLTGEFRNV